MRVKESSFEIATCETCGAESPRIRFNALKNWLEDHWKKCPGRKLDCLYCPEKFDDFALLAAHVLTAHNPQGYGPEYVGRKEEWLNMKLNPTVAGKRTQLLPGMLRNLGSAAVIVDVRDAGAAYQFSDYCIDLKIGKQTLELPVKAINEDFQEMIAKHGLDTDRWKGKKLTLSTEPYTARSGKVSEIVRFTLAN